MENVTFPITIEALERVQEQLTGEPIPEEWYEVFETCASVINAAYEQGRKGNPQTSVDIEKAMRFLSWDGDEALRQFAYALRAWRKLAYEYGIQHIGQ